MVEFKTAYYSSLDRGYNPPVEVYEPGKTVIEQPIIPLKELGQTVPESDPRTGAHILQTINAAIRAGAGSIQIAMTTPSNQPIGGRPKAYGKEVRQAIREVTQATGVVIEGVEMPTSSMSNLSGYDPQRGVISDQKRQQDIDEVRDAIKFVADIAGGGEVDIWSQEFPRTIFDASWNPKDKKGEPMFYLHKEEHDKAVKTLVDKQTGRIIEEIRLNQTIDYPEWEKNDKKEYVDYQGKVVPREKRVPKFDRENNQFILKPMGYYDFKDEAREQNEVLAKKLGKSVEQLSEDEKISLEEAFIRANIETRQQIARGWAEYHKGDMANDMAKLEKYQERYKTLKELREKDLSEEQREIMRSKLAKEDQETLRLLGEKPPYEDEMVKQKIDQIQQRINYAKDMVVGQMREVQELERRKENIMTPEKFAKPRTFESYAELGIFAMNETESNPKVTKPLYVGPELGWPYGFGGHPDEFLEIVQKSREKMADRLIQDYNMSEDAAKKKAETHIKGLFDTSHLGMWLAHYRRKDGESEDERLKSFNKWFLEQSERLAKSGTVGAIQAVDSASAAHGHLPPGQGIFPVVEAVKKFKEHGFKGAIVSEGHEEERFGANRILYETWKAFGSPIYSGYEATGLPFRFPDINEQYHKFIQPSAYFIRSDYAPDQREWTLWSQAPLE